VELKGNSCLVVVVARVLGSVLRYRREKRLSSEHGNSVPRLCGDDVPAPEPLSSQLLVSRVIGKVAHSTNMDG
jgi:hypothetical protein